MVRRANSQLRRDPDSVPGGDLYLCVPSPLTFLSPPSYGHPKGCAVLNKKNCISFPFIDLALICEAFLPKLLENRK
jgi:hypothetical protein